MLAGPVSALSGVSRVSVLSRVSLDRTGAPKCASWGAQAVKGSPGAERRRQNGSELGEGRAAEERRRVRAILKREGGVAPHPSLPFVVAAWLQVAHSSVRTYGFSG